MPCNNNFWFAGNGVWRPLELLLQPRGLKAHRIGTPRDHASLMVSFPVVNTVGRLQSTIRRSWAMSPLVGICHELALSTALAEWVLRDDALPRSEGSLIEANRCVDLVGFPQLNLS